MLELLDEDTFRLRRGIYLRLRRRRLIAHSIGFRHDGARGNGFRTSRIAFPPFQ
jgi:hypothetical protein